MKMNAILVLSLLLKAAVSIQPIFHADDHWSIYALPVGQGDCTVIQCPKAKDGSDPPKGTVSIIDAGSKTKNTGIGGQDLVDFLAGTKLNLIVLTHSDEDHINYIDNLLEYYKKNVPVYHSCKWSEYYKNYIKSQYASPQEIPPCQNIKDCWNRVKPLNLCPNYQPNDGMADSVTLSFVASAVGKCKNDKAHNEDSLIAKITYAGMSTLIAGDFELGKNPMDNFLNQAKADLKSDIYRLSHHGSFNKKANRYDFLDAVNASCVFSSSGYMHRHPRCEVYDYYKKKLPENVRQHPYTCFNQNSKEPFNEETKRPIYVTSVREEWLFSTWEYHLIVGFHINELGTIYVTWDYLK